MPRPPAPTRSTAALLVLMGLCGLIQLACTGQPAEEGSPEPPPGETPPVGAAGPRPDVVLVTFDTTRADHVDLDASDGTHTPTAAALAARGLTFEQAFAPAPLTLPSHASLLSGLFPVGHGARNNGSTRLVAEVPTLAEALRDGGYSTGAVVAALPLVASSGLDQGFSRYDDQLEGWTDGLGRVHPERTAEQVTTAALALAAELPAPRFLWVHYFDPHTPYTPPEPHASAHPDSAYTGEIAYADAQLGALLEGLPPPQGDQGRLVVLTADHGESLGEHGEATHGLFVHDATTRVPLVMSWPGHLPEGRATAGTARLEDVAPTLLDLLALPVDPAIQGRSLRVQWSEEPETRGVYGEAAMVSDNLGMAPLVAWREQDLRLVRTSRDRLFDLAADPTEAAEGAAARAAQHPEEVARRGGALEAFLAEHRVDRSADVAVDPGTAEQLEALGYVGAEGSSSSGLDLYTHLDLARALTVVPTDAAGLESAITRLEAALAQAPEAVEGWQTLVLLAARSDEERGAAFARQAEAHHPEHPFFQAVLAAADARAGDQQAAARRVRAVVARVQAPEGSAAPASGRTLAMAAQVALGLGMPAEGLVLLDALEAQVGRYGELGIHRAMLRHEAGRPDEAAPDYRRWLEAHPDDVDAWRNLGYALAGTGDLPGARDALRESLRLAPDQPEAASRLELIEQRLTP